MNGPSRMRIALGASLALAGLPAANGADFEMSVAQLAGLAARQVVVDADVDRDRGRGDVRAAIRIDAPPSHVYAAMTRCDAALRFVPNLRACVVLERDPQGRFEIISHISDLGWFMPATRYTFRAQYDPPRSVDFRHVTGDLRENEGRWELVPIDSGRATHVTYLVRVVPRVAVPQWVVRGLLKRELPELLLALRDFCERTP